jgi:hypothetical protein
MKISELKKLGYYSIIIVINYKLSKMQIKIINILKIYGKIIIKNCFDLKI